MPFVWATAISRFITSRGQNLAGNDHISHRPQEDDNYRLKSEGWEGDR